MTTLLNLFYAAPIFIGMIIALIALVAIYAPWRLIWECVLLANTAMAILVAFWISEAWMAFKKWMRKPSSWEDDLPDLFI